MEHPYKGCRFDYVLHLPENLYKQFISTLVEDPRSRSGELRDGKTNQ